MVLFMQLLDQLLQQKNYFDMYYYDAAGNKDVAEENKFSEIVKYAMGRIENKQCYNVKEDSFKQEVR